MILQCRGNCHKCGKAYLMPHADLGRHQDDEGNVMCWQCCKEVYWGVKNPDRCSGCSELTMCKGLFVSNFKNHIAKGRMEGV